MNLTSFDIEIYDDLPVQEGVKPDLSLIRPSIAAMCRNVDDVQFFYDLNEANEGLPMSKSTARFVVDKLMEANAQGYPVFGWNTTAFDLPLLGYASGMLDECAELALTGVDGMLLITFNKGYFLGLDAALKGAHLESKLHTVTLKDDTVFSEMSGIHAPRMWRENEVGAVKAYLRMDVTQPLLLSSVIETKRGIQWTSKTGKTMFQATRLLTVAELFKLPEPDTSWMTNPPRRTDFISWMPEKILRKYI